MGRKVARFCAAALLCALFVSDPVQANIVVEPTFAAKMAEAELVAIGTVTASHRGGREGAGSTVTFSMLSIWKGPTAASIVASPYSRIDELNFSCCRVGETYLLFLQRWPSDEVYHPLSGQYGMIRIGGGPDQIRVIPAIPEPMPH